MRTVEHFADGPHKLLRIEADGCAINVIVGLHDDNGARMTVVEVEARYPDGDAMQWEVEGPNVVVVRRMGVQHLVGDSPYAPVEDPDVVAAPGGIGG